MQTPASENNAKRKQTFYRFYLNANQLFHLDLIKFDRTFAKLFD